MLYLGLIVPLAVESFIALSSSVPLIPCSRAVLGVKMTTLAPVSPTLEATAMPRSFDEAPLPSEGQKSLGSELSPPLIETLNVCAISSASPRERHEPRPPSSEPSR